MKSSNISKVVPRITFLILTIIFSHQLNAQIRLVEVDPVNDTATIQNFGASMVPINDYWFCTLFVYNQLSSFTIDSGSLNLASGATVKLSGLNLRDSDADLGLYTTNSFGSAAAMSDFMQWGDAGNGRESVANSAGLWTSGEFLAGSGPFVYSGNGTQNGASVWNTGTLSINDELFSSSLSIYPNPVTNNLTIQNLEGVELKNVALYSTTGTLIRSQNNLTQQTIDLKGIQEGLYMLRLTDANGRIAIKKIIKN